MNKGTFLLIPMLAISISSLAQDTTGTEVLDQLEQVFEELDVEEGGNSSEQLIQFLQELEANPVNINTADLTELLQIPGITFVIAQAIIRFRVNTPFEALDQLLNVPGIGRVTLNRINPYITIGGVVDRFRDLYTNPGYWLNGSKIEVISRYQQVLEEQDGFKIPDTLGGYLGNQVKYFQRFRVQSNHLSINLTQEKDAGESVSAVNDFDFTSTHLSLNDNGYLKKFVAGDYSLSFGQGLVLWTSGAFGKSREVIKTIGRNERGLKPYSSSQETNFFRGVAATIGDKNEMTVFYSNRPRTASVMGTDSVRFPSSSGFHRTINEQVRRNNIDQQTIGSRVRTSTKFGLFGFTAYSVTFSMDVVKGTSTSNFYDFEGRTNSVLGFDYRYIIGRSLIFGEIARSNSSGVAGLIGLESSLGESTEVAVLYRDFGKKYQSVFGDGFSELSGTPQNERGFYFGLKHHISEYTVSTYFDQYTFGAPRDGMQFSSKGMDVLGMIEGRFSKVLRGYILIRAETKDDSFKGLDERGRETHNIGNEVRRSLRIQLEHQPLRTLRTRTRLEWARYQVPDQSLDKGFLLYQDLRLILSKKLQVDTRFTVFETDSFGARVYQFENDLRYILSNVTLSDKGQRWYCVVKYDIGEYIELSGKISQTVIEDAHALSSGLSQIDGNTRTFIGLQAHLYFR